VYLGVYCNAYWLHAQQEKEADTLYVRLDSIRITGIERTKSYQILREMNIAKGAHIAKAALPAVINRNRELVYNTGLFNVVTIADSITPDLRLWLHIDVHERWYVWPEFIFDLTEYNYTDWLRNPSLNRVTLGLGVNLYNLSGRNDKLSLAATRGFSNRYELSFDRPFLLPKARIGGGVRLLHNTQYEVDYGSQDNGRAARYNYAGAPQVTVQSYGLYLSRRFRNQHFGLVLGGGWKQYVVSDSVLFYNPRYLSRELLAGTDKFDRFTMLEITAWYDTRDVRAFPLKGVRIYATAVGAGMIGPATTQFARLELRAFRYQPLGGRWYAAGGGVLLHLIGSQVPFPEKFFARQAQVRGFNSFVLDGSLYAVAKAEVRYALVKRRIVKWDRLPRKFREFPLGVYPFAYMDYGYMNDYTYNNLQSRFKNTGLFGYGVGVDVPFIYDNLFRVEVGYTNFSTGLRGFNVLFNYNVAVK